jgi:hypothetical protein
MIHGLGNVLVGDESLDELFFTVLNGVDHGVCCKHGFSLDKQAIYRTRPVQHPMFYCSIIYVAVQHKPTFSAVFCEIFLPKSSQL